MPGVGTLCVSSARSLRPATPGRVRAMEDGPLGGVRLAVSCYVGGGGGAGGRLRQSQRGVCLTSAD